MINKPNSASYWVLPGSFLAGGYPVFGFDDAHDRQSLCAFVEFGINTFFDLTRPDETSPYRACLMQEAARHGISVAYRRMSIQDRGLPTRDEMVAILDAIQAALEDGRKIYLHCFGGIGRTGTVVGCWLVRQGMNGLQALLRLNELYKTSEQSQSVSRVPETDDQVRFILEWTNNGLA